MCLEAGEKLQNMTFQEIICSIMDTVVAGGHRTVVQITGLHIVTMHFRFHNELL